MFCQFNYLLNYCWKSIVKSIIFSIIAWYGLVKPCFESSLNPSLDSKGKGLSRVWTQAYNWPIWGSVSDPCPCPPHNARILAKSDPRQIVATLPWSLLLHISSSRLLDLTPLPQWHHWLRGRPGKGRPHHHWAVGHPHICYHSHGLSCKEGGRRVAAALVSFSSLFVFSSFFSFSIFFYSSSNPHSFSFSFYHFSLCFSCFSFSFVYLF